VFLVFISIVNLKLCIIWFAVCWRLSAVRLELCLVYHNDARSNKLQLHLLVFYYLLNLGV